MDPENSGSNFEDPQSWNGYAYARNNPPLYTDPGGKIYVIWSENGYGFLTDEEFENEKILFRPGNTLYFTGNGDFFERGDIVSNEGNVVAHYAQVSIDDPAKRLIYEMQQNFRDRGTWARAATKGLLFGLIRRFQRGSQRQLPGASDAVKPLGRGSTGRTTPKNLKEQLAMEQVRSNPTTGVPVILKKGMTDPRWPASDGGVKMRQNVNGVEIHYVRNTRTGEVDDFKFQGLGDESKVYRD